MIFIFLTLLVCHTLCLLHFVVLWVNLVLSRQIFYSANLCGFLCRRGQPTVEFIFAATEEAIFVHVIISAK